ncbi:MAG: hypothetical protein AB7T49_04300 [Oligoflexales bacterium]
MKSKVNVTLCAVFFTLLGCTKMCGKARSEMTPEEVVETYLNVSLNMRDPVEKENLLALTTGTLKSAIMQASDETIQKAFIERNYQLDSYSVVERRDRTPRETEITFRLQYRDLGKNRNVKPQDAPVTTTENTVSVIKEEKSWFMKDVLGKKTSIDFPVSNEVITPE